MQKNDQERLKKFASISDFIWVKDNVLTPDFCKHCIEKFEKDGTKSDGCVGSGIRKDIKDTKDVMITSNGNWPEEDEVFQKSLTECLHEYEEYLCEIAPTFEVDGYEYYDTGYQIQRYEPDAGYRWHHDDNVAQSLEQRAMTFIWYLNSIKEDGYTEFVDGTRVRAKEGRIVIFPSGWTFLHRGYPPKNQRKYICTGWLHAHG